MAKIQPGRTTHDRDDAHVVFLIGMRVNRLYRPDAWLPAFLAMGPMIAELSRDPESGFLGVRTTLAPRGPLMVQWWRSIEHLYAYAAADSHKHRPAWLAFYRRARKASGAVGLWHETYSVDRTESVYYDMPITGLAAAVGSTPVTKRLDRARDRLSV